MAIYTQRLHCQFWSSPAQLGRNEWNDAIKTLNENKKSIINERAATVVAHQAEKDNTHSHIWSTRNGLNSNDIKTFSRTKQELKIKHWDWRKTPHPYDPRRRSPQTDTEYWEFYLAVETKQKRRKNIIAAEAKECLAGIKMVKTSESHRWHRAQRKSETFFRVSPMQYILARAPLIVVEAKNILRAQAMCSADSGDCGVDRGMSHSTN